jgi:hypothetical protein
LPDAEFTFQTNDNGLLNCWRGALEVELTPKDRTRLAEKISKYANRGELAVVIWVCGGEPVFTNLRKSVEELRVPIPRKFRFVLYSDLLKNGLSHADAFDWQRRKLQEIFV